MTSTIHAFLTDTISKYYRLNPGVKDLSIYQKINPDGWYYS